MVKAGRIEKAEQVFDQMQLVPVLKWQDGLRMLDLHGYSHGAGILALKRYLSSPKCPSPCGVISGKGCDLNDNYLVFKENLQEAVARDIQGWTAEEDRRNSGVLILRRDASSSSSSPEHSGHKRLRV
ncbi:MAG: hypothetical protein V4492_08495 [Chlamydiota bacterium]